MRILRAIVKFIEISIIAIFIVVFVLFIALQTPTGQQQVLLYVLPYLEQHLDMNIQVGEVKFVYPFSLQFKNIIFSQDEQNIANIGTAIITCSYRDLSQGQFICNALSMSDIEIINLPKNISSNSPVPESDFQANSYLPFYFKVDDIQIKRLHFASAVIAQYISAYDWQMFLTDTHFDFNAAIENNPMHQTFNAQLMLTASNRNSHTSIYDANLDIHNRDHQWQASIKSTSYDSPIPYTAAAILQSNNIHDINISQLKIESLDCILQGELHYSLYDKLWQGSLEANINEMAKLAQLWNLRMSGVCKVQMDLNALQQENNPLQQYLHANIACLNLQYEDVFIEKSNIRVEAISLDNLAELFQLNCYLESHKNQWRNVKIDSFQAESTQYIDFNKQVMTDCAAHWSAESIVSEQGTIARADGKINGENMSAIKGYIHASFHDVNTSHGVIEELVGDCHIDYTQHNWPFFVQMHSRELLLSTEGSWQYQMDTLKLHVDHINGQFGSHSIALSHPFEIIHKANQTQLSQLNIQFGEASIQAAFNVENELIYGQLSTNRFHSSLLTSAYPDMPFSGFITTSLELTGSLQHPQCLFNLFFDDVLASKELIAKSPLLQGQVQLTLTERDSHITSIIQGAGTPPIEINGLVPVAMQLDHFALKIDKNMPLHLNVNTEGELTRFLNAFKNDNFALNGYTKVAIILDGSMHNPQVSGTIDISQGNYESNTGALFHNIQAHLEGNGSKIILSNFIAYDQTNGMISATGDILIDTSQNYPFEFQLHPVKLNLVNADYANLAASGNLIWNGNLKRSKLHGNVIIDQATVHLEESLPHQVKTVDIRYINLPEGESYTSHNYLDTAVQHFAVDLEINVQALNKVTVTGNRLSSEWKGDILITGNSTTPLFNGELRIVRGEYKFNGKTFNLSQGTLHFSGKKTSLYAVASRDIERVRAEIIVKGPLDSPAISFRSNPPLSQREVLSYILFNRGISDISKAEGDQLTHSFISLNANEEDNHDDFISRLRNNIGLDRLDFDAGTDSENKELSLQMGKYITRNIFVSINKSITDTSNRIAVDAKLHRNLKAEADVGDDGQVRMSLKWKKDY